MDPALIVGALAALGGVGLLLAGGGRLIGLRSQATASSAAAHLDEILSIDGLFEPEELVESDLEEDPDQFARHLAEPFGHRVLRPAAGRVVDLVTTLTPRDRRARVRAMLVKAGLDTRLRPEELIALQVLGLVVGAVLGTAVLLSQALSTNVAVFVLVALVLLGLIAPMAWLRRQVDQRAILIRAELPETLDLLAVSVEAGLSLESAMAVVAERSQGPLAQELARSIREMGLGSSRHDALISLRQRSGVAELATFIQALVQADVLGMPIGRVLKIQAGEMRSRQRQWARERAAKLPVKILFPLIACIFPAVLVVVLGPAVSQIGQAL